MGALLGGSNSLLQQAGGAIGQQTTGLAQSFTPQNQYQAGSPLDTAALQAQLTQSQGGFNQTQTNQNALAAALLAQSQGQGPNVAQQQLNQATNQNIAQNQGMIASQKGINPALAARLGSENAGYMSQQAAGQGAVLGTQQQLGAQQQLAGLYNNQAAQNNQNAQLSGALANQSSLGAQQINAGVSAQNAAATQNASGGLLNSLGSAAGMGGGGGASAGAAAAALYKGGTVHFASGGQVPSASSNIAQGMMAAAGVPQWAAGGASSGPQSKPANKLAPSTGGSDLSDAASVSESKGGTIPRHLHPVAQIYHPDFQAKKTAELKAQGGKVPGKAKVNRDSYQNDTEKTILTPGEVVIDLDTLHSKGKIGEAARMVAKAIDDRNSGKGDVHGDFKEALKKAVGSRRSK